MGHRVLRVSVSLSVPVSPGASSSLCGVRRACGVSVWSRSPHHTLVTAVLPWSCVDVLHGLQSRVLETVRAGVSSGVEVCVGWASQWSQLASGTRARVRATKDGTRGDMKWRHREGGGRHT